MGVWEYVEVAIGFLAGIGTLLVGMKMMSGGMERAADKGLRKLFSKMSDNRFAGVGVGCAVTALVQSSSATTVMVVGFVNAGVMTLFQATSIIMGANIGTTVTAQILALQSFSVTAIFTLFAFVGVMVQMFAKSDTAKNVGFMLAGLGITFVGLALMSDSMSELAKEPVIVDLLERLTNPILLALIGVALTAVIQSSAAVTAILIGMVGNGILVGGSGNGILFVIMGTNVGTCMTSILSSIGTNANAKRAAFIHFMFNFIGSAVFIVICLCWADFKAVVIDSWIPNPQQQIAMFHTLFNVFTTALLIPFSRSLVKLSQFVIREKKSPDEFSVKYIDERILQTPAIALAQLIKEMSYMLEVAQRALDKAMDNFINRTEDEEPIRKDLREINFLSGKVTDYLIRLSEEDMSHNDELTVSSLYKVLSDIMRVADFSNNIMRYLRVAVANELYFSSEGLNEIKEMYSLVDELFKDVDYTFANRTTRLLAKIEDTESKTDKFKLQLQQNHLDRLKGGNCKSESSSLYVNLIGNIERVADHLVYIAQSVKE